MKQLLLILILTTTVASAQEYKWFDKPMPKSEAILILTNDSPSVAYNKIKKILALNGYMPNNNSSDENIGVMVSESKTLINIMDHKIRIVGNYDSCYKLKLTGVLTFKEGFMGPGDIVTANKGLNGSGLKLAWKDLEKCAMDYGGAIRYGVLVKKK